MPGRKGFGPRAAGLEPPQNRAGEYRQCRIVKQLWQSGLQAHAASVFTKSIKQMATTPKEILRIEQDIVRVLKNIYDPEIPINIYDLGLIYEIDVEPGGETTIRMTLTAPTCPMAEQLIEDVNSQVAKVKGVTEVNVILTFEPPWDREMISEEALLDLGLM